MPAGVVAACALMSENITGGMLFVQQSPRGHKYSGIARAVRKQRHRLKPGQRLQVFAHPSEGHAAHDKASDDAGLPIEQQHPVAEVGARTCYVAGAAEGPPIDVLSKSQATWDWYAGWDYLGN